MTRAISAAHNLAIPTAELQKKEHGLQKGTAAMTAQQLKGCSHVSLKKQNE